jgi:hypothetical protein
MLNPTVRESKPSQAAFRLTTMLFAVLLGVQCVWLLLAELARPDINGLPANAAFAAAAAKQRDAASWAASIGAIRGDLWAKSAFTYADLLWAEQAPSANTDLTKTLARARVSLDHALDDGPHQSSAWLLLAGLALRFPSLGLDPMEPLKMSYYTGPSEQQLVPLRLRIAVHSDRLSDIEIRQFVGRDLRLLLARNQKSAIAEAYNAASPAGRSFIEQAVGDVDPSARDSLRTGAQKQPLPD